MFWLLSKVPVPSSAIKSIPGTDRRWRWKGKGPSTRLWLMMRWGETLDSDSAGEIRVCVGRVLVHVRLACRTG